MQNVLSNEGDFLEEAETSRISTRTSKLTTGNHAPLNWPAILMLFTINAFEIRSIPLQEMRR